MMLSWAKKKEYLAAEVLQKLRDLQNTRPQSEARTKVVLDILDLFQRSPSSTNHLYDLNANSATALHWFLKEGEDIDSIKALCQICPRQAKLLRTKDSRYDLPLHVACQYSSPAVIEYLTKKTPKKALRHSNTNGYLACHHALLNTTHNIPLSTMKLLLQHYKKDYEWDRCWSLALLTGQAPDLLEIMLEKYPNQSGYLNTFFRHAQMGFHEAQPMQLGQAAVFTKLCQKLKRLSFHYKPGWDCNAFVHFWTGLQTTKTLTRVEGITLPNLARARTPEERQDVLDALQSFLECNTGVQELSLYLQDSCVETWHAWMVAIDKGLAQNTTCESLKFDNYFGDSDNLKHCILNAKLLTEDGKEEKKRVLHPSLENFDFDQDCFIERLKRLPHNLQSLTLGISYSDFPYLKQPRDTTSIAHFVSTVPKLKELQIRGYFLDPKPIFEALHNHPSLKTLNATVNYLEEDQREDMLNSTNLTACVDLVQNHNLNLLFCSPWSDRESRISYHLDLNRFGRAEVRTATTCQTLVDVLTGVENHKSGDATTFHENRKASMRYGLLRELPTLWCYAGGSSSSSTSGSSRRVSEVLQEDVEDSANGVALTCGGWLAKRRRRRSSGLRLVVGSQV